MCLDKVTRRYAPNTREMDCWKVFEVCVYTGRPTVLRFPFGPPRAVTVGWMSAGVNLPRVKYPLGFHCLRNEGDAAKYRRLFGGYSLIRKVRVRGLLASGIEAGCKVIVAQELFVYPKEKA